MSELRMWDDFLYGRKSSGEIQERSKLLGAGLGYRDPSYAIVAIHRSSEVDLGLERGFPVANKWQCPGLLGALPGLYLVRPSMIYTASLMQGMLHPGAVGRDPRS